LRDLADGKLAFAEKWKAAKNPLIIVGMGALAREDGAAVLALARSLATVRERLERLCRAALRRRRASAGSTSAWCRARAAATSPASWPARRARRSRSSILLAADELDMSKLGKAS
jgi:NADH-quinone oxidoreductase subunit G